MVPLHDIISHEAIKTSTAFQDTKNVTSSAEYVDQIGIHLCIKMSVLGPFKVTDLKRIVLKAYLYLGHFKL